MCILSSLPGVTLTKPMLNLVAELFNKGNTGYFSSCLADSLLQDLCDNSFQPSCSKSVGLSTSRFASESLESSSDTEELQDLRSEAFPSKTNKRKRPSDEPESSDVDFEDTDDPLLIAKVKLRPNKGTKPEHVQQIRAIKTKNMQTVEKEDKESNVVNLEAKAESQMAVGHRSLLTLLQSFVAEYELS
ncbi:unnamed protein product [Sphagnum troendelagicum]